VRADTHHVRSGGDPAPEQARSGRHWTIGPAKFGRQAEAQTPVGAYVEAVVLGQPARASQRQSPARWRREIGDRAAGGPQPDSCHVDIQVMHWRGSGLCSWHGNDCETAL